jgi:hypothetical protein
VKTVYVEGEGLLTEDGRYFPEANVRAAMEVLNRMVEWINGLPPELQAELRRLGDAPSSST